MRCRKRFGTYRVSWTFLQQLCVESLIMAALANLTVRRLQSNVYMKRQLKVTAIIDSEQRAEDGVIAVVDLINNV